MNFPRGSFVAVGLIIIGALLFLDNLGLLPIHNIGDYWPLLVVAWGVTIFERKRTAHSLIWATAVAAFGCLLLLGNLHIIHVTGSIFWPLMLIAFGATMLVRRTALPASTQWWHHHGESDAGATRPQEAFYGNRLMETIVFGGSERRVESQNFEGGKVEAVFGGIELDLSDAAITSPDRRAVLEVNAVFGGIEIRVPRTWRVEKKGSAVFGGFEDRTFPPRPEPGVEPPTLVIRGAAVFGGIEIKN
jgi:predicted membrane protein